MSKTQVDFVPIMTNKDFRKVRDGGTAKYNTIILSILNQLYMQQPTLTDYPEVGCYNYLLGIHFSESYQQAIQMISMNLTAYSRYTVELEVDEFDEESKNVNISVSVRELPDLNWEFSLAKDDHGNVRVVNPETTKR